MDEIEAECERNSAFRAKSEKEHLLTVKKELGKHQLEDKENKKKKKKRKKEKQEEAKTSSKRKRKLEQEQESPSAPKAAKGDNRIELAEPQKKKTKDSKKIEAGGQPVKAEASYPQGVDSCRPANFGRRKEEVSSVLAKAKQPVTVKREKPQPEKRKNGLKPPEECELDHALVDDAKDDLANVEGMEDEADSVEVGPRQINRKHHERSCKKKTLTDRQKEADSVKDYIGGIGLTYDYFQFIHPRPVLKNM